MSASSVRRLKERDGGGAKVAAPPTGKGTLVVGKSVSTGKENPRPTSRPRSATQKPTIRPMARIDKSAVAPAAEEPRSRWSNSSAPRGRSSSPSEFTRVISDLRKNSSRVYLGPPQRQVNGDNLKGPNEIFGEKTDLEKRGLKELERGFQEKEKIKIRVVNNRIMDMTERNLSSVPPERPDLQKSAGNSEELERIFQENDKIRNRVQKGSREKKESNMCLVPEKRSELENYNQKSSLECGLRSSNVSVEVKMKTLSSRESTMASKVSNFTGILKENVANKYPSKLHEKLAFLEGKVKKIASDINRTKEMLDLNNPDSSKMILSDIQEKITGIEKAMVHVSKDGDAKTELIKVRENKEKTEANEVGDSKFSVKGLSVEELEARLFPHHKLMRDRTLSKTTSRDSEMNVKAKKVSSLDENEIALEFLASLSIGESRVYPEQSKIQETDEAMSYVAENSSSLNSNGNIDALLIADEKLYEFDDQEVEPSMIFNVEKGEDNPYQLNDIGCKTSTGGWFVSEGESVLLAHDDGSCSFYDIANCEKKAEYKPPSGISPNTWQDCWMIRAPSADGCSGRYVVAASAGNNSVGPGFCSWDFYTKDIRAFHFEDQTTRARTTLVPLSNTIMYGGKNSLSTVMATGNQQWWYKPCGPLITSTASCQRTVQIYDIRDGDQVMEWELQKPVLAMGYSSPLHWRNRGKVVIAESDAISLWDVNSLCSQALLSVSSSGRKISALHVNNTDGDLGGGVRQRISSVEAEGNDGVFCTPESINVLDFRHPSGIGLKIPRAGAAANVQSAFSHGDSIYIGSSSITRPAARKQCSSQIQQFSLRAQRLFSTYALPESNAHESLKALTQVWGNSSHVMGVCGLGLFVFDGLEDNGLVSFTTGYGCVQDASEVIGPDDMCCPSFDYSASRVLLVSKDRPARWRHL